MRILVTGVTGYIGGSVAKKLVDKGHEVTGLMRNERHLDRISELGIKPLLGSHVDQELVTKSARAVDAVVNAADSDDAFLVSTLVSALEGTGKTFIHTSGSSIVADRAAGEPGDFVYHEDIPFEPVVEKAGRVAIDKYVLSSALKGVRSVVICPCLIYGQGSGIKNDSYQVPRLIEVAKQHGKAVHVGRGLNIWSNVHIDDLTELYALALEKSAAGSFFFAESGEASMKSVCESISTLLGYPAVSHALTITEAINIFGAINAYFTFGSNSRISAEKARKLLDWKPNQPSLLQDIEKGSYARLEKLVRA